jgi:hypothetical protein
MAHSMSKKQKETLIAYASVLRVPPEIYMPLVSHFTVCVEANGPEWSVNRFKSVKQDFINLKAGLHCQSLWVSRNDDKFHGAFGGLQNWTEKNWKNWSKAIQLLQIYSTEISDKVTPTQAAKFVDAVTFVPSSEQNVDHYCKIVAFATKHWFSFPSTYGDPEPLLVYPVSSTRREPHANGKSYPEGENTLDCAYSFLDQTTTGQNCVRKYPDIFKPLLTGLEDTDLWSIGSKYYANNVGKIGLIQEPGFKLRAVANPARVYQAALKPLGNALYSKLAMLPWDCTHDQYRPFTIIQNVLKEQKQMVHAIDLSNATDRFPLKLQMVVLNTLFHRKDAIQLFEDLSRAKWNCSLTEKTISWTVGQPLGLFPSFAAFSLTHGMMLYALNGMKHNDAFFVLGDDVVILNDDLASKYKRFLQALEIPFSPSKTISSNVITEFAGKLITSNEVIPQLKWRHVSDDSFIDLAKHFGEPFRKLMRSRQRKIFDLVKTIPDFLGGCGFNPKGIPLEEKVRLYYELQSTDNKQSYLMSYNGRLQSMNYQNAHNHSNDNTWIYSSNPIVEFDQNSSHFAAQHLTPKLTKFVPIREDEDLWKHVVGNPLYVIYPRERCLPIAGTSVRTTTLDVLERKFGDNPYLIDGISAHKGS